MSAETFERAKLEASVEGLERLLRLADFLETVPPEEFNFGVWRSDCGTAGCAIGWMHKAFPELNIEWVKGEGSAEGGYEDFIRVPEGPLPSGYYLPLHFARRIFSISMVDAKWLFVPEVEREHPEELLSNATAKEVAAHIRRYVERGSCPYPAVRGEPKVRRTRQVYLER